jgi:hypothetical protein
MSSGRSAIGIFMYSTSIKGCLKVDVFDVSASKACILGADDTIP